MTTPDQLDDEVPKAARIHAYPDEQSFRLDVAVGDYVRAGRDKHLSLAPNTQYITKGQPYRVLNVAIVENGFCIRATTDIPGEVTYLSWADLDMKDQK